MIKCTFSNILLIGQKNHALFYCFDQAYFIITDLLKKVLSFIYSLDYLCKYFMGFYISLKRS